MTLPWAPRGLVAFACTLFVATNAHADLTKAECVEADTHAQNERRAEHFRSARALLDACSKLACPKLVRDDCAQRLDDLDAISPSLVVIAKDATGNDLVAVRVIMDGTPLASELTGAALPVDPGPHTFRFESDGLIPIERKFVLREGEKGRQEHITFAPPTSPPVVEAPPVVMVPVVLPPPHTEVSPVSDGFATRRTAGLAVAAVGVGGVIAGAVFGGLSFSSWSSSKSECGTAVCTNHGQAVSDHDSAVTDATIADIGFIAGGVLVATGLAIFLTAPHETAAPRSLASFSLVPAIGGKVNGLRLLGSF